MNLAAAGPLSCRAVGNIGVWEEGQLVVAGTTIVAADAPALALLAARRQGSVIGRDLFDFVAPAPPQLVLPDAAEAPGQLVTIVRLDGAQEAMELNARPTTCDGAPATAVTLGRLSGCANRLQRAAIGIASDVPDAVLITDADFDIIAANEAAERMTGVGEDELIGGCITATMAWPGCDEDLEVIVDGLHRAGHWHGEAAQLGPRHASLQVHTTVTVLRDAGGRSIGTVWVTRPTGRAWRAGLMARERTAETRTRPQFDSSRLSLLYEPVVRLSDAYPVALEARPASMDPDVGLVDVRAIIDTLETPAVIEEIDTWLLQRAFTEAALWWRSAPSIDLIVTVSGPTFANPDFTDLVSRALSDTGTPPGRLWIKIAERALVADIDRAEQTLRGLGDLGLRLMIADFGVGLPVLAYLSRLPVHGLHIHPALEHELAGSDTATAGPVGGIEAIVGLGKELGLAVITNDASGAEYGSSQILLLEGPPAHDGGSVTWSDVTKDR